MTGGTLKAGDFTGLAQNYSKHRPDYSETVLTALLAMLDKPVHEVDAVDVGAGTGIWTRMIHQRGVRSVTAVEPNDDMRREGEAASAGLPIEWRAGSAEHTTIADASCDWLSMASSFHWADFDVATREFHRALRPGGRFVAIWNPRLIEINPMLVAIEAHLNTLRADIKRVSSGRSGITETLTARLWASPCFEDVVYIEGRHVIRMSPERYLGAWRSVNDLLVQLGPEKFEAFMAFVSDAIRGTEVIEATYWTRAWSARRKG
ncbi:MAG: class I SAM-dependent methyltransferase [Vicinamibacterales bacterium]